MINYIVKLNIDDRLKKNEFSLVEDIANISVQGKNHHLLHFASVYCNFHKPEVFPIYSDQYHDFYRKYIAEFKLPLDPENLTTYEVFFESVE